MHSQRAQTVLVWLHGTRVQDKCQDEEGYAAHSKDGCGSVKRKFSSPGFSHLVFGPRPSSSCQSFLRRVEVQEGRAGEGKHKTSNLFRNYWTPQAGMIPRQLYLYLL